MIHVFFLRTSSDIGNFAVLKVGNHTGENINMSNMMKRILPICDGVNARDNILHFPNGKAPP